MNLSDATVSDTSELRPVIGLTRGLNTADIEILTVNAIRLHRQLVEKADQLFQALPADHKTGQAIGGEQHLKYVEAMIAMHAQMKALNTLVRILGFIPNVSVN
ncbi:transcriptional regulator [Rhizobium sp. P38BS-XIX]|uniref:transcriptional repressor TraM n=1 Tax=Rhizobium sp. P38BS-XIX TaxID=2726740 RepID=UPI0014566FFB|nr:transcriptional repressor TraM [Rhizobium sp. P38BS-XIX]NLR97339.1 transcriptional regulator [Rhizobium sp. P38BS-XIX]